MGTFTRIMVGINRACSSKMTFKDNLLSDRFGFEVPYSSNLLLQQKGRLCAGLHSRPKVSMNITRNREFILKIQMLKGDINFDEFVLVGNRVVHGPTGSWWRAYRGKAVLSGTFTGGFAASLKNGEGDDVKKIQDMAFSLLVRSGSLRPRKQTPT